MNLLCHKSGKAALAVLALAMGPFPQSKHGYGAERPPNFVFILADDQGWTGTSVSMHPEIDAKSGYYRTPNLARLAKAGMRFTQGYAPAALCSPTRRSLQFGQTPVRQGDDEQFAERYSVVGDRATIPRLLKSVNPKYAAAHFGKWDLRLAEERGTDDLSPELLGYDESDGNTGNGEGSEGDDGAPDPIPKEQKWTGHAELKDPKRIFSLAERANDFMTRMANAGRPFFVQVSQYAVHADFQSRAETYRAAQARPRGDIHTNAAFAAMTEDLDAGVGQLLDQLDELKIREHTYVIYMADNGGVPWIPPQKSKHFTNPDQLTDRSQNYPLRGGKWGLFEGGIRVPFIVRGPGIQAGSFCNVPVVGWDILPTIADLAGYKGPLPDDIDGGSFRELLEHDGQGAMHRPREYLVFHRYAGGYAHSAVRDGDYKLIRFWQTDLPVPVETYHLFDLSRDRGEANNLADMMPDKVRELDNKLNEYLQSVDSRIAGRGQ